MPDENRPAASNPRAKSVSACLPASGARAWAAWDADCTLIPALKSVEAHVMMMKAATATAMKEPAITSMRE